MAVKPIRVAQLNGYIKRLLQSDPLLGNVSVIGEISGLKHHGSGHIYFNLKDADSRIHCFLPSDALRDIRFELTDGLEIVAEGYLYLYERGGSYSLNIRDIRVEGAGNLSLAFERLKERLAAEGLFDERYKKPLPAFPETIGVVTSETGAALRDILAIIRGRNQTVRVIIFPTLVQGPGAAADIAAAIGRANRQHPELDLLIVGRGGGSREELWAFNEEIVARSIFASAIPVISAVGHEIDFSISDFVADRRAATPTAAAQMAVPDTEELRRTLFRHRESLKRGMEQQLRILELKLAARSPERMKETLLYRIKGEELRCRQRLRELRSRLAADLGEREQRVRRLLGQLEALNPAGIMERGYAAILDGNGVLRGSAAGFHRGDALTACFRDGKLDCVVTRNTGEKNDGKSN